MSDERIKLRGRAAELRDNLRTVKTRADNHIITIRSLIDPLDDIEDMAIERAEQAMISLKVLAEQAKEYRKKLERIEELLNG